MRPENAMQLTDVTEQFAKLGPADRKAILARFEPGERAALEHALARRRQAEAAEELRKRQADRQFLGYSAAVAAVVERAVKNDEDALTPQAREAVAAVHQGLIDNHGSEPRRGWRGLFDFFADLTTEKRRRSR